MVNDPTSASLCLMFNVKHAGACTCSAPTDRPLGMQWLVAQQSKRPSSSVITPQQQNLALRRLRL